MAKDELGWNLHDLELAARMAAADVDSDDD